jgi:uncharacterized protein (TIGR03437 family)
MYRRQHSANWAVLGLAMALPASSQTITTVAGNSTWGAIYSASLDAAGNLYTADSVKEVVYKVDRLGATTIVAGTSGKAGYSGDGSIATGALLSAPAGVAVSQDGSVYIADYSNQRIRKVGTDGIVTTIAGTGTAGFSGDGGPASKAQVYNPFTMAFDSKGVLFFVDFFNHRIRKIGTDGVINTVAGGGNGGDGGPATSANLIPGFFALAGDGSIYFNDDAALGYSLSPTVRKVSPSGVLSTVAGNGIRGYTGDGGAATSAALTVPQGVALDSGGNLYIAGGNRIRKVAPNGIITTYAGTGAAGATGDGGLALSATFNSPSGMTVDSQDNLYVVDYANREIRKIAPVAPPTISFTNATVPVFLGQTSFNSNMYVTLYGSNLATTSRAWTPDDFVNGKAPTTLDGVSVTVNNIPAFVEYVSPSQININTPEDSSTGPVVIQVKNGIGTSNAGTATRARLSPTLQSVTQFSAAGKSYVVAQTPDFRSFIGPAGLVAGVSFVGARPGSTVIVYAVGCGPTNPATQAGVIPTQNSPLALSFQVKIGGIQASVPFAGMLAGSIGLYQFNVVIPTIPAGDQLMELIIDGVPNAQSLMITVGQ